MPAVLFAYRGGSWRRTPVTSARVAQCLASTAGSMWPRASSLHTRQAALQLEVPSWRCHRLLALPPAWSGLGPGPIHAPQDASAGRAGPVATHICAAAFSLRQRRIFCAFQRAGCGHAPTVCANGCGAALLKNQVAAHDMTCPLAPSPCPCLGCGTIVPRRDLNEHLTTFAVEHARAVALA